MKKNDLFISYGILACNEHVELKKLLKLLVNAIDENNSEIVLLLDENNTTDQVQEVVNEFTINENFNLYYNPLNNDFSAQKNHLNSKCKGKYILQLDADELLEIELIQYLPKLLETNPDIDLFYLPRKNIVDGITEEYIKKNHWHINENGYINFPDYQSRLFKNKENIYWEYKVHERITGFETYHYLPEIPLFCIYHHKNIEKQIKQNDFYSKL